MPQSEPLELVRTHIAGVSVRDLAARFGTPVYIYDAAKIVDTCVDVSDDDFESAVRSARALRDGIKRAYTTKFNSPLPGGKTPRDLATAMSVIVRVQSAAATQAQAAGVLTANV